MNPNALSSPDGATSFFKAPQASSAPAAQAPVHQGPGDFTRMMQSPKPASAPAIGVPVPQQNQPAAAAAPIFSQPSGVPAPPPVAAPAPAAAPGFLKGMSPMLLVACVVVVLMIAALLFVIIRTSH